MGKALCFPGWFVACATRWKPARAIQSAKRNKTKRCIPHLNWKRTRTDTDNLRRAQMMNEKPLCSTEQRGQMYVVTTPTPFTNEGVLAKGGDRFSGSPLPGGDRHTVAWTAPTSHRTYPGSPP